MLIFVYKDNELLNSALSKNKGLSIMKTLVVGCSHWFL